MLKTIARQIPQIDRLVRSRNDIALQAELLVRENTALHARVEALEEQQRSHQQDDKRWEQCVATLNDMRAGHTAMLSQIQAMNAALLENSRPAADTSAQMLQVLLKEHYRRLAVSGSNLPSFADVEFRCHSQNGEDGILLYIFSLIGTTNRKALEMCAGAGIECNSANLIINHGFHGFLFDGDPALIEYGRRVFSQHPHTFLDPPHFASAWITAENVNELVLSQGLSGEIDLLSLDIDGNDYWVWKSLTAVNPRVVILECNGNCGPQVAATMAYDANSRLDPGARPFAGGASLAGFVKLAREKGYRLVGTQRLLFNAFFLRDDIICDALPETTPAEVFAAYDGIDWDRRAAQVMGGPQRWVKV